VHSWYEVNWWN